MVQPDPNSPFLDTRPEPADDYIGALLDGAADAAEKPAVRAETRQPEAAAEPDDGDEDTEEFDFSDGEADEADAHDETDAPEAGISDEDLQSLKRAKYSEKAISKMSPELAAELAEKACEDRRANDREYQEYLAQKRKAEPDESERQEAAQAAHPSESTLQDFVSLSQPFADDLGVEPERLAEFAKVLVEASSGPLQQQLATQSALLEEALIDSAVSRLSGEFPQLRGSDKFADVVKKATRLLAIDDAPQGPLLDRITAAMREASSGVFKDEVAKRALAEQDKKRNERRQKTKGQPSSGARKGGVAMSQDDWLTSEAARLLGQADL